MIDWAETVLAPDATLGDAIKRIDATPFQVALVLDSGRLAGLLTDGDVRRALIKGVSLDAPVSAAMNALPTTALAGTPFDELVAQMRLSKLRHMPLVDDCGAVVGLETLDRLTGLRRRDNWVVLMAGGLGSRLAPLTDNLPKPMLNIGTKPLLQTILEKFIDDGFYRFFLSVNYLAETVKAHFGDGSRWGITIVYLEETQRLGTGGALSLLPGIPELPLVVMNGDVLTKVNFSQLLDFHEQHHALGTMCVREYEFQVPYGVVTTEGSRISQLDEKPIHKFFVNAGIYVLEPRTLTLIPANAFFDMPSLFRMLIDEGSETAVFPIREYWLDIGHIADYQRANGEYSDLFA